MDAKTVMEELGLSAGEIKVYLALLKMGESPVSELKKETKMHRTTIYDFIEKLLNKSLVSSVVKGGTNYYKATHPSKIMDFLKEKEDKLKQVMPELIKLSEYHKEEIKVEVYRGKEGFKTLLNLIARTGKDMVGFGFEEEKYEKLDPLMMKQHFRRMREKNIHESVIVRESTKFLYDYPTVHYKTMPDEYFNPNPTMVFGDYVGIQLWEPLTVIVIQNKGLADAYRKYYKMLLEQDMNVYRGNKAVRQIFDKMVEEINPGEAYLVFGASQVSSHFDKYFENMAKKLQAKGSGARAIFDESTHFQIKAIKKYGFEVRTLPKEYVTPAEVNIYQDKVFTILWTKEPQAWVIENKAVADSYRKYFDVLWKTAKE